MKVLRFIIVDHAYVNNYFYTILFYITRIYSVIIVINCIVKILKIKYLL